MKKCILPITVIVCIAAIGCMICVLTLHKPSRNKFTPPAFDKSAQNGIPSVPDNMGYSKLDAKVFKVSVCGKLTEKDGKVDLYLTNPQRKYSVA